jgi:hypothetical protein
MLNGFIVCFNTAVIAANRGLQPSLQDLIVFAMFRMGFDSFVILRAFYFHRGAAVVSEPRGPVTRADAPAAVVALADIDTKWTLEEAAKCIKYVEWRGSADDLTALYAVMVSSGRATAAGFDLVKLLSLGSGTLMANLDSARSNDRETNNVAEELAVRSQSDCEGV